MTEATSRMSDDEPIPDELRCERCEGDGSYRDLAPCTTMGSDCACNGPRVIHDPCEDCDGSGLAEDLTNED
jgi:DnaJ-class molecular chaperone